MPVGTASQVSKSGLESLNPPKGRKSRRAISAIRPTPEQKSELLKRVDALRLERVLNWAELATLCDVSLSTLYHAIQYGRPITDLTYVRLLRAVGEDVGILQIGGENA